VHVGSLDGLRGTLTKRGELVGRVERGKPHGGRGGVTNLYCENVGGVAYASVASFLHFEKRRSNSKRFIFVSTLHNIFTVT